MIIESSSIWKAPFFQLRDKMGFDVILSNPYVNRLIAQSKKKTDKIDAKILADLDRGDYLAESCPESSYISCSDAQFHCYLGWRHTFFALSY